jgi:hypothetical protein
MRSAVAERRSGTALWSAALGRPLWPPTLESALTREDKPCPNAARCHWR